MKKNSIFLENFKRDGKAGGLIIEKSKYKQAEDIYFTSGFILPTDHHLI